MADVARLAGVSHQTVSRVINGQNNLRPATRERVEQAIQQLGYRPNSAARALVTRRSATIGVIGTDERLLGPAHRAPHHPGRRPRGRLLRQLGQPAERHPPGARRRGRPPARPARRGHRADRRQRRGARGRPRARRPAACRWSSSRATCPGPAGPSASTRSPGRALGHPSTSRPRAHRRSPTSPGRWSWTEADARLPGLAQTRCTTPGCGRGRTCTATGPPPAATRPAASCWPTRRASPRCSCANDQMALGVLRALAEAGRVGARRRQRRRLRRHPRGGVPHPAADHRPPGLPAVGQPRDRRPARRRSARDDDQHRPTPDRARAGRPRSSTAHPSREDLMNVRATTVRRRRRLRHAVRARRRRPRLATAPSSARAVHEYPHGVIERRAARLRRTACRRTGRCRCPTTTSTCCAPPCPRPSRAAGIDPADVIGIATDFTACTMVPTLADGTPLCELAEFADRPHAYVKLWKHHAAQARPTGSTSSPRERGEPWLPRYGGLISSEWEFAKGLQLLEEDPEVYDRDGALGRGRRLDRLAAVRHVRPQRLHRRLQGHPARTATTRRPDFLAALNPASPASSTDKLDHPIGQLGDRAGALTAEAAAWTGLPEGIAVAVGNVDAHVTAPAAQAVEPGQMVAIMGTSTCHVMSADVLRRGARACAASSTAASSPGCGATRPARAASATSSAGSSTPACPAAYAERGRRGAASRVHEHLTELARRAAGRRARPGRARLAQRQPLGARRPRAVRAGRRADPGHPARGRLPGAARGDRVRHPHDRRDVPRQRACRSSEFIVAGGLPKNPLLMQIYADVTRLPLSVIGSEQGPALGSAIHAAVAAGAYPDVAGRREAMGKVAPRRLPARRGARRRLRRSCSPSTARCTTTSAAATTTMHRLQAHPPRGRRGAAGGDGHDASSPTSPTPIAGCAREVCALHAELTRYGLVVWTAGNVSRPGARRTTCW